MPVPRSVEDIKAEMAHLKNEGVHHMSKPMRSLREELKEAEAEEVAYTPSSDPAPEIVRLADENDDLRAEIRELKAQLDNTTHPADLSVSTTSDAWESPEGRFLEQACAELELDLSKGVTSDLVKKIYNQLVAKVMAWRVMREILQEIGPGGEWPQWAALGRNPSTGLKDPKFDPKRAEKAARPAKPSAESVSEGGMPVRPGRPSPEQILAAVTGGDPRQAVLADVGTRTVADREQVGAPE